MLELLRFPSSITKFPRSIEQSQSLSIGIKKDEYIHENMNIELSGKT